MMLEAMIVFPLDGNTNQIIGENEELSKQSLTRLLFISNISHRLPAISKTSLWAV